MLKDFSCTISISTNIKINLSHLVLTKMSVAKNEFSQFNSLTCQLFSQPSFPLILTLYVLVLSLLELNENTMLIIFEV